MKTSDIVAAVKAARDKRAPLRIVGAGTWLDGGMKVVTANALNVRPLAGIVAYEPGDLTLTAHAGTSLEEIADAAGAARQWLPLDPAGSIVGTIGATVATASYGPLAASFGTPRDQLLGLEFVTGRGEVARGGGRVVKNVAGFDLARLMTGAWGTLGVLTEITVRLRAIPEVDETVCVECSADAGARWLRESEFTPMAAEWVSPSLARHLGIGAAEFLVMRLGGNSALVRAAHGAVAALGPVKPVDVSVWKKIAECEPANSTVVRLSVLPSLAADLWTRLVPLVEGAGGFAHGTPQRGVVRCIIPQSGDERALGTLLLDLRGKATCVAERAPTALWRKITSPGGNDAVVNRVRQAFDPDGILNPGIL